ncbi:Eukaryotic translation initiation factor 3 subunit H [Trichinella pseudospiralis]|uniref:Eukaryotic translation initiation factor 3 subunit H n=1 Tax=Trichinella pseudospiralis TaxID=6337 RepID=A0A0V0XKI1_TRIPS|nr:Eukaryotic translation initiation factor 3 subunit H [Trichinella pseudospiralis]KRX88464.1 Eukaryotic translation initiation factor 3 subunit H [Trichinella pseudospiralis]
MSRKWFEKFKNVTSTNLESLLNDSFVQRMFRIFLFYDASRKEEREILMKNQNNSSTTNSLNKSNGKLIFIIRSLYHQLIKMDSCLYIAPCETVSFDSMVMENDEHVQCDNFKDFISLLAQKFPVTLEKMQQAVDEVYEQIVQQIFCQGLAFVKRRKFSNWKIQWIQVSPGRLYTREIFSRKSRKILCLLDKYSTVLVDSSREDVIFAKALDECIQQLASLQSENTALKEQLHAEKIISKDHEILQKAVLRILLDCFTSIWAMNSYQSSDELLTKKSNVYKSRKISCVQLSSLVVSKIVMHGEKERCGGATEAACGFITGLVNCNDDEINLEVTNCFPIPKREMDTRQEDLDIHHQHRTLKYFRTMNIDYLVLGYYQTAPFGGFFTETMIQSLIDYQTHDEDSVALVYGKGTNEILNSIMVHHFFLHTDPVRCIQGQLDIKAYRLSPRTIELCSSGFTLDVMKNIGVNYSNLLEEIPVLIKNSRLSHLMICKMALAGKPGKPLKFLNMCSSNVMEKNLKLMMINMEVLNAEVVKYNRYLFTKNRYECQKESWIHKRLAENELRRERGEPPLPVEEEFQKIFKMPVPTKVLDGLLASCEINAYANYCRQQNSFATLSALANMLNVTLHYEKDVDHVFMVLLLRNLENGKLLDTVIMQNDTSNIQMDIKDNVNWCGLTVTGTYKLADGQRLAKAEFFAFQMITEVDLQEDGRSSALLVDMLILPGVVKYHFESELAKQFTVVVQLMPACPIPNFPQQLYLNSSQNQVNIVNLVNITEFSSTTEIMQIEQQQLCWIVSIQCFQVDYTYERQCQMLKPKFANSNFFNNNNNTGLSKNSFAKWSLAIIILLLFTSCFNL